MPGSHGLDGARRQQVHVRKSIPHYLDWPALCHDTALFVMSLQSIRDVVETADS